MGREGRSFKIKKILLSVFSIEGTCSPRTPKDYKNLSNFILLKPYEPTFMQL